MKIFGFTLFEEDPEFKVFRENVKKKEHEDMVASCEGRKKNGRPVAPLPELGYIDGLGLIEGLWVLHKRMAKKGECHTLNGKKYCYHTGKEIITEDKS